jgi:ATP-dependent Lon protease
MADKPKSANPDRPDPTGYVRLMWVEPHNGNASANGSIYVPFGLAEPLNAARRTLAVHAGDPQAWQRACAVRRIPPETELDSLVPLLPAVAEPAPPYVPVPSPRRKPRLRDGRCVKAVSIEAIAERKLDIELRRKGSSASERRAEERMLDELIARGEYRIVGLKQDWRVRLDRLAEDMPNFAPVVQRLREACALADFSRTPLRIPPLLLAGDPGVGKSRFALQVADLLGVSMFVYALESAETTSVLTGSEKHWADAEPGELYKRIVHGTHANPVIVLDELDKVPKGSHYHPANALHAVLEPETARRLRDKAADMVFDASHVVYLATTNRLSAIDDSLLSRFELIHVPNPDVRQAVAIARSIGRQLLKALKLEGRFEPLRGEVLQKLALLGVPRRMHQLLAAALGRAIVAGRGELRVDDLLQCLGIPDRERGPPGLH